MDRHPKVRHGVLIGAGATILGNIEIGNNARIAAGSVVTRPLSPNSTAAGVPARVIAIAGDAEPARTMDQILNELSYASRYDLTIGACRHPTRDVAISTINSSTSLSINGPPQGSGRS